MLPLALVVLCGAAILVLTDACIAYLNSHTALRFRWSLPWYAVRYSTIASGLVLAWRVLHT